MLASFLALLLQGDPVADLVGRLGDDDPAVRHRAASALDAAGEEAVPALLGALGSPDAELRGRAAELLERRASRAAATGLRLSMDVAGGGPFRGTLRVANPGAAPVLLYRPGLGVAGVVRRAPADSPFVNLGPGETHEEGIEGIVRVSGLRPEPFYVAPGPVVVGLSPVRVLKLRNEDPAEVARVLLDLFAPPASAAGRIRVAFDLRTRSIVLCGDEDLLRIAAEIVGKLDGDPAAPETQVVRFHQGSAEDLARTLERLLRP